MAVRIRDPRSMISYFSVIFNNNNKRQRDLSSPSLLFATMLHLRGSRMEREPLAHVDCRSFSHEHEFHKSENVCNII